MTFQPVIAGSGLAAWTLLNRTLDTQSSVFAASPEISRDTDYFEATIGSIDTAEDLVSDRRLLRVALGAFGLQDDINNLYFIRRVLEEGSLNEDALANKLTDSRYKDLAQAFGFGDFDTPRSRISDFGPKITDKFRRQQFEVAVGEQDDSLRLAMNAERSLPELAESSSSNRTKWLRIMGNPPLRSVMEGALGMPESFSQLDLDRQVDLFMERATRQLGSDDVARFSDPEMVEKLVQRFLLRNQVEEFRAANSASGALSILESAARFAKSRSPLQHR